MANEANGTPETPKEPSLLETLHKSWVNTGSKVPNKAEAQKLLKAWKDASGKRDAAEEAFKVAQAGEVAAVKAIVLARGKSRLKLPTGESYIPMSRGETVYLRREGGEDTEVFG